MTATGKTAGPEMRETATLGGGCFWCLEAVFNMLQGVEAAVSGYSGGHTADPDYETVCGGDTGHAEVVRLQFDPAVVSYRAVLDVFFAIHDPTTLNFQGSDVGTQYRSVIFFHSPEQQATAGAVIRELTEQKRFSAPIVTEVVPAAPFYEAEAEHQEYFRRSGRQPYCQYVVAPKLIKFRKQFARQVKRQ